MAAFEAIVIGAGYIGCAISYYLAQAGLKTVLVDQGGIAAGASKANYGNIQVQDAELDHSLPMVLAGRPGFETLADELGQDIGLRRVGSLLIAETESHVSGLLARAQRLQLAGVAVEWLSPPDLARLEPHLNVSQTHGALYNSNEAQINPFQFIWAFVRQARKKGLQLRLHSPVEDFIIANGRVKGVVTPA